MTTEFGNFYKFETLTLCPFDLSLFDTEIMTNQEIEWVNEYHRQVREALARDSKAVPWNGSTPIPNPSNSIQSHSDGTDNSRKRIYSRDRS